MYLVSGHNWLNIWEHIGVLRWTGLDGVFVSGTRWPPYFGRALEIWEKLAPYCTLTDEPMEWIRPRWKNRWVYANGRSGYVEIEPHKDLDQTGLDIEVKIDYLTLGEETRHFRLPCSTEDWHTMLASKSPGWPRWRYEVCCLAEKFGWPHMNSVTWPQEMPPSVALQQFALHRVGDLLGALSLVSSRKLLSGKVTSYCAGHEADLGLLGTTLWMPVKSKVAV